MTLFLDRILPLGMAMLLAGSAAAQEVADRIYTGGPILTMEDGKPRVEAVAVRDGRILAAGSLSEIEPLRGETTELFDLAGRAMVPGFVDSHGHVVMGGLQAMAANLLAPPDGEVRDIASLQETLRDWAARNADFVEGAGMIIGFGYDNAQLAELRHPTRADLDAVSTEYPVMIVHQSGHLGVANSRALEMAGIDATRADPEGGVIRRDAAGAPNGVLEEYAFFEALIPLLGNLGPEVLAAFAKAGSELWASYGYTTGQD
ncbi:amidohydrolase, partial [Cribrihabitans sp. XS_ASV171]